MDSNKKTSYLLLIIGVLIIGLAGCIGYIAGNGGNQFVAKQFSSDEQVMKEINELKSMYDAKISQKTASFKDIKQEKDKIAALVFELEKTKADAESLVKYKTEYQNLESKMHILVDEIVTLKSNKSSAIAIKKQPKSVVDNNQFNNTAFSIKNNEVKKVIPKTVVEKKATQIVNQKSSITKVEPETVIEAVVIKPKPEAFEKVSITNLKSAGYIVKSATKNEETTSAGKTDMIKIQFTLEENPKAKAEEVKFYIQVIDSKNNVIGRKITEYFDDKTLTYSYTKSVFYNNEKMNVEQQIVAKDFEKGTYFVNIFDRNRLVARTDFTLK